MMMSEWKEYRFSDLLIDESISYGIVQPGSHKEYDSIPIIRVNNIKDGSIQTNNILKVDKEIERKYQRTKLHGGELLITVVGSVGECAIVSKSFAGWNVARAVSVARFKNDFDIHFVKYSFKTDDILFQMYGNTNDTVQPTLNLSELKSIKFNIPSLPEQRAIATILSCLDDKIDLLHRQNKTLEAMAEALFRQWFVEEAEEEWEMETINQLVFIQNGYAFKGSDFKENGGNGVLKIKNISGGIIDIENTDFVEDSVIQNIDKRFKIRTGDILIAMTGAEIGKLGIIPNTDKNLWLNQRVGLLTEKFPGAKYLAYLRLNSDFGQDHIENTAAGSAQPNISATGIENCGFPIVNKSFLEDCALQIKELYDLVIFNLGQIHTLAQLRDTLLPKLMSGEVRVN